MDIPEIIKAAGIVGAGGGGFPAHVKASAKAEVVIANGAECEPLLQKDREILKAFPEEVLEGLRRLMQATGARRGVLAVKSKHEDLVALYRKLLKGREGMELKELGDFYPAGDEFSLVFEATGKVIPPGGIPLQIGAVVSNVETLYNISQAEKTPVVDTFLTVAGAVKRPCTLRLPVGTSFSEAITLAGGAAVKEFSILDGGAMMGRVAPDPSDPVTKTTGGLIVLPRTHSLIMRKSASRRKFSLIGKSACDQCSFCTQFCPRYLLGYRIEPHRAMRSLLFSKPERKALSEWALLCCECSLCSLYACPEDLDPRNVCVSAKEDLRELGVDWKKAALNEGGSPAPHPMRDFRKVPIKRLIKRLGLQDYRADAPLLDVLKTPIRKVRIPLKQHAGVPAEAVVKVGEKVERGQLLADIPAGKLGARVHASIGGTVRSVDSAVVIEG